MRPHRERGGSAARRLILVCTVQLREREAGGKHTLTHYTLPFAYTGEIKKESGGIGRKKKERCWAITEAASVPPPLSPLSPFPPYIASTSLPAGQSHGKGGRKKEGGGGPQSSTPPPRKKPKAVRGKEEEAEAEAEEARGREMGETNGRR